MVLAAIKCHQELNQADYKNAFCNSTLPDDEIRIICLPLVDPNATLGES
jgi:hypothetical protein